MASAHPGRGLFQELVTKPWTLTRPYAKQKIGAKHHCAPLSQAFTKQAERRFEVARRGRHCRPVV